MTAATAPAEHAARLGARADQVALDRLIEEVLAPFHMRPHWGKLFTGTRRRSPRSTSGMATSCACRSGLTRAAPSAISGSGPMFSATPKMDCAIPA